MHVILFDIDGTLISSHKAKEEEKQRFGSAIRDIAGKAPAMDPADFAGMVDPQICKILITEIGLPETTVQDVLPRVIARMGEVYRTMTRRLVLNAGVDVLLRKLLNPRLMSWGFSRATSHKLVRKN